jgi:hypothetical protein
MASRGSYSPRFTAVLLLLFVIASAFFTTPAMAAAKAKECKSLSSCRACVTEKGCGWTAKDLKCAAKGVFAGKQVKAQSDCTPLRDSLVRLGDSLPAVSKKLVGAYDQVKSKITK